MILWGDELRIGRKNRYFLYGTIPNRAISQAISRWLSNTKAGVYSHSVCCRIFRWYSDTVIGFSPSSSSFLCYHHCSDASYSLLYHVGWTMVPLAAAVPQKHDLDHSVTTCVWRSWSKLQITQSKWSFSFNDRAVK